MFPILISQRMMIFDIFSVKVGRAVAKLDVPLGGTGVSPAKRFFLFSSIPLKGDRNLVLQLRFRPRGGVFLCCTLLRVVTDYMDVPSVFA